MHVCMYVLPALCRVDQYLVHGLNRTQVEAMLASPYIPSPALQLASGHSSYTPQNGPRLGV